jgi:hypothetical protein
MKRKTASHIAATRMTGTRVDTSCEADTGLVEVVLVLFDWACQRWQWALGRQYRGALEERANVDEGVHVESWSRACLVPLRLSSLAAVQARGAA